MTIGITIYGTIQSHLMTGKLEDLFKGFGQTLPKGSAMNDPRQMLTPETRAHIPVVILHKLTEALSSSIAYTFMWTIIPAILGFITIFFMGRARMDVRFRKAHAQNNN